MFLLRPSTGAIAICVIANTDPSIHRDMNLAGNPKETDVASNSSFVGMVVATMLITSMPTWAQPMPTSPAQPSPERVSEKSCWHPGLSRNIGIAEQSCDPMSLPNSSDGENNQEPRQVPAEKAIDQ